MSIYNALWSGIAEDIKLFMDGEDCPNELGLYGRSALQQMAVDGLYDMFEKTLQLPHVDPYVQNQVGESAVSLGLSDPQHRYKFHEILKKYKIKNHMTDVFPTLPTRCSLRKCEDRLLYACAIGRKDQIVQMIQAGHDLNQYQYHDGTTPLMVASYFGRAATVRFILEQGVNVHAKNVFGYTALMYATGTVTKLLLNHGADPNDTSLEKEPFVAFHFALMYRDMMKAKLLYSKMDTRKLFTTELANVWPVLYNKGFIYRFHFVAHWSQVFLVEDKDSVLKSTFNIHAPSSLLFHHSLMTASFEEWKTFKEILIHFNKKYGSLNKECSCLLNNILLEFPTWNDRLVEILNSLDLTEWNIEKFVHSLASNSIKREYMEKLHKEFVVQSELYSRDEPKGIPITSDNSQSIKQEGKKICFKQSLS